MTSWLQVSPTGAIQLYDLQRCSQIRRLTKQEGRVSSLMFMNGLLVSGSKDKSIVVHDLRMRDHVVKEFCKHNGQVCTLKAKNSTETIFASGSVDGSAIIWDLKFGFIDQLKSHSGAVKALDWCPWKSGILATGGGNNSGKSIKLWNTCNSTLLHKQPISSQISSIIWNQQLKMMISSHGYSDNEIQFWKLNTTNQGGCRLQSQKKFKAHSGRVLNMMQSHDQSYLCSVGSDQVLKFWYLFEKGDSNPFKNQQKKVFNERSPMRL